MARLGLNGRFDAVCCRDDVGNKGKPSPDVYLFAAQAVGVEPNEALALEDSRNGMLAAKAAGMHCVVVPNEITVGMNFDEADAQLSRLNEMPLVKLLEKVQNGEK